MKRCYLVIVTVGLLLVSVAHAQKIGEVGSIGFGASGGLMLPASGDMTADSSFSDFFGAGPGFGVHVNYLAIKQLTLQAGFDYAFMKMDDDARGDMTEEPYFTMPCVYLDGIWNLGTLIKSETNTINPYLLAGGGLYFWKVTEDGAGGDAIVFDDGEEFSKTSFGLQFGGGLEVFASPRLSIFAEGKYHMVFTEDTDKFGDDFSNVGVIGIKAGVTYHLPLGSR